MSFLIKHFHPFLLQRKIACNSKAALPQSFVVSDKRREATSGIYIIYIYILSHTHIYVYIYIYRVYVIYIYICTISLVSLRKCLVQSRPMVLEIHHDDTMMEIHLDDTESLHL